MSSAILASYTVCLVYWIVRVYFHGMLLLLILFLLTSTSDLQPSTAISNPSPGKSVLNKFKP